MSSQKKVVIITGASQGIGEGLVKAFRENSYGVVATSRSIKSSTDAEILAIPGDISTIETAERAVQGALDRFGRIDTLINNAGVFTAKPFVDITQQDFDTNFAVNVSGFFHITQRTAKVMLARGSGHIVNITTSLVNQPIAGVPAALASLTKGGLNSVTQELAIEFATSGIRVNAVSPGVIKTPMHAPETHATMSALHPVGRMGEIADIVNAVLYLENASFVTGEILHVDGGQNAGRW